MIQIDFTAKPKEIIPHYVTNESGWNIMFDQNGLFHSYNDLPSLILPGWKLWHKHGELHRGNGFPAVIWPDGHK